MAVLKEGTTIGGLLAATRDWVENLFFKKEDLNKLIFVSGNVGGNSSITLPPESTSKKLQIIRLEPGTWRVKKVRYVLDGPIVRLTLYTGFNERWRSSESGGIEEADIEFYNSIEQDLEIRAANSHSSNDASISPHNSWIIVLEKID